jgi:hypothetical protein
MSSLNTSHVLEWSGSILAVSAAILLALNIELSPWAYVGYLFSSLLLTAWGLRQKAYGIAWQNSVFILINLLGIYRWLLVSSPV